MIRLSACVFLAAWLYSRWQLSAEESQQLAPHRGHRDQCNVCAFLHYVIFGQFQEELGEISIS